MHIGILQTGHAIKEIAEIKGDYADMFQHLLGGHGFTFSNYNVVDGEFPAGADSADGWLITGSRHGAYEDHPWIAPLEDLIRAAYAASIPVVGICFGHQIIAQALGGKVVKFPGGWRVGRDHYDMTGVGPLDAYAWHQDQVVEVPEGGTVIGRSDFCKNAIIAYGDRALSYQPHPEFDSEDVDKLIRLRGKGVVPDDLLNAAEATRTEPVNNDLIATQIADFFLKTG